MSKLGPYTLNSIITGDARELAKAIPSESVDIIFTDPIYDEKWIYSWLAEFALRVLKPSGACLIWSNGKWHKINTDWLEESGLTYRYTFTNIMVRAIAPMNGHIISRANRVVWLDNANQSKMTGYLADGSATTVQKWHKSWEWSKSPKYCEMVLEAFAEPNQIVVDPFCGAGTIPAVSKMFGYRYLGFELDNDRANKARQCANNVQIPLPLSVSRMVQSEMSL